MHKVLLSFSICFVFCYMGIKADEIEQMLTEIEKNNKQLQAQEAYLNGMEYELKSGNNLPDPVVSGFYLPYGSASPPEYSEIQISQTFEFPTVYSSRSDLINKKMEQNEAVYQNVRQEVLLSAKKVLLELIYVNKKLKIEQERIGKSEKLFNHMEELYSKEEIGRIKLNKGKIAWLQDQFKLQQIERDKRKLLIQLQKLNGGTKLEFELSEYPGSTDLNDFEKIWEEKKSADPAILILTKQEDAAQQEIAVSKSKWLPDLTAGINYQGFEGAAHYGFYGGLTIPLWSNRHKVDAARAKYQYQVDINESQMIAMQSAYRNLYDEYMLLLEKYKEYEKTLNSINSDSLLYKAYELGEISFTEYYNDLRYYREAYDYFLEMEKELNLIKAELYKHTL